MTTDEERELLGTLMDAIEAGLLQKIAMTTALDLLVPDQDWRSHVEKVKLVLRPRIAAMLQPLRDVILGNPLEILQESEWRDAVRKLIESAGDTSLPE
jgi:hypothetical protein